MRVLIGLFIISSTVDSFGQTDVSRQTFVEHELKIPPVDNSSFEFEIRLTVDIQQSTSDNFVWIKNDQGKWNGQSFKYSNDYESKSFKVVKSFNERINADLVVALESLLRDNFSDIADQKEVVDKLTIDYKRRKGDDAEFLVKDGTNYYLTIKAGDKIRRFNLHSPWTYLNKFPDSMELKWYCDILDSIDKSVKIKVRD